MFIVLLALAAWSRQHRARPPPGDVERGGRDRAAATTSTASRARPIPSVRGLRWSVGGELVFGIAMLVITAMLVNSQPARSALSLPYSKEFREPTMLVDLIVSPAKAGPVDIHVYTLTPAGGNLFTPSVTAEMSLPVEGHRADHDPARARRPEPLPRVRAARSTDDRHRNVHRQVLDSVRGQVARRDPRAAQRVRRSRGTDDRRHQIARHAARPLS